MLLEGRTALITGAGGGLGAAVAAALAEEGARIVAVDRDLEGAAGTVEALEGDGHKSRQLDVTDPAAVDACVRALVGELGGIDVLVNAAGVREIVSPLEIEAEQWSRVIAINLSGTFFCCQAVARHSMGEGGAIVNFSSTAGLQGAEKRPAYIASKTGVIGLTRSLAADLGPRGIRVNAVCPGLIPTAMTAGYFDDAEFLETLPITIPLGGPGTPRQVATAVLFLASEMAGYVTGAALPVDGGFTSKSSLDVSGGKSPFAADANSSALMRPPTDA